MNVRCQIIQLLQKIILNIKMHKVQFFCFCYYHQAIDKMSKFIAE